MHLGIRSRRVGSARQVKATVVGVAIAAAAVVTPLTLASGAPDAAKPAAGTIHMFVIGTRATSSHFDVLITGAFADHGTTAVSITAQTPVLNLSKGTIKVDVARIEEITDAPNFGTFTAASCSFLGSANAPITIVAGTGAYKGIQGTMPFKVTVTGIASRLANGTCNTSQNSTPAAFDIIGMGTGQASF
jgi:hypothetical protein